MDVFWLFDDINDGQVTFKNITTTEGVDVRLMDSAAYALTPPMAMYIHYQLIRINNDVFVRRVMRRVWDTMKKIFHNGGMYEQRLGNRRS